MVNLKHKDTGLMKNIPSGFSWTTLFFGCFVPLLRGDAVWFGISFVVSVVTMGIFWLVFPFVYNGIYIKKLLSSGFVPANETSEQFLKSKGWIA